MNGRVVGLVYLLYFAVALVGEVFAQQAGVGLLSAPSVDPASTAQKLLSNQGAFRVGFALSVLAQACYIGLTALFYRLFKPVNPSVALLAAFFSLVANAVQLIAIVFLLTPLTLLATSSHLQAFTTSQLQALALLALKWSGQAGTVYLPLFGLFMLMLGYLIVRSTFLPWLLGVWFAVSGLAWTTFLIPPLASQLRPIILLLGTSELALMLWLLVKGVDEERWMEQSRRLYE